MRFGLDTSATDSDSISWVSFQEESVDELSFNISEEILDESVDNPTEKSQDLWNQNVEKFFKENSPKTWQKFWSPYTQSRVNEEKLGTPDLQTLTAGFCQEHGVAAPCIPFKDPNDFVVIRTQALQIKFLQHYLEVLGEQNLDLDLSRMNLVVLSENINTHSHVEYLKIQNNALRWIPRAFTQFSNLRVLNLSYNQIEELPEKWGELASLQVLNIAHNQLTKLSLDILNQLPLIKKIDASHNQIQELPEIAGESDEKNLKGLTRIERGQRLREGQVVKINLKGNPLSKNVQNQRFGRVGFVVV
jgi:Leucine-rich repeat (LRR) protein